MRKSNSVVPLAAVVATWRAVFAPMAMVVARFLVFAHSSQGGCSQLQPLKSVLRKTALLGQGRWYSASRSSGRRCTGPIRTNPTFISAVVSLERLLCYSAHGRCIHLVDNGTRQCACCARPRGQALMPVARSLRRPSRRFFAP